jgi:hypothetical protein
MYKVFELADVGDENATPHRFRHTFARILLERGVPLAAVADLMGDSEQVVRDSYNRWVPERQAALTKILKDAFHDKGKLVGFKREKPLISKAKLKSKRKRDYARKPTR